MRHHVAPFGHPAVASLVAFTVLTAFPLTGAAQAAPDTLVAYGMARPASDSATIVRAVDDALQGESSITVPMETMQFARVGGAVIVTLRPVPTPGVVWHNLGGTVRLLADGRRVILGRQ